MFLIINSNSIDLQCKKAILAQNNTHQITDYLQKSDYKRLKLEFEIKVYRQYFKF